MRHETGIAESIRTMDQKAQYDAACKRLLSEKIILAWILKCCLVEFHNMDVNEIAENYIEGEPQVSKVAVMPDETNHPGRIHGISTEDASLTEGKVVYDIRFTAIAPVSGEHIRLIINLEAQNEYDPGYPLTKRGIFYCSRNISSQYGREFSNSNYQDIKKVYSIWVAVNPPVNRRNTITRYRIVEENVVGQVTEPERNYDLMTMLMICLGNEEDKNCDILRLLNVLLSEKTGADEKKQILQEEFQIPMTETLEGRLDTMCNLSEGVYTKGLNEGIERGIKKGIEQGIERGIERGIETGTIKTSLSSIKSLMKNTGWPLDRAMKTLEIPERDRAKYAAMLEET